MAINPNWAKWVAASAAKHFVDTINTHVHVEGSRRDTDGKATWVELRVDGPDYFEHSGNEYRLDIVIDALIVAELDGNTYGPKIVEGECVNAFTHTIKVFKYGKDGGDDQSFIGTMSIIPEGDQRVIVTTMGSPTPTTEVSRTSVEGRYRIFLTGV